MTEETKPWWNDGDKVGGLAATICLLMILALIIAGVVKLIIWMF